MEKELSFWMGGLCCFQFGFSFTPFGCPEHVNCFSLLTNFLFFTLFWLIFSFYLYSPYLFLGFSHFLFFSLLFLIFPYFQWISSFHFFSLNFHFKFPQVSRSQRFKPSYKLPKLIQNLWTAKLLLWNVFRPFMVINYL